MRNELAFSIQRTEPLILIISGLSGSGKDTVLNAVKNSGQMDFHFVVTCNTRAMREGETDGVDYHFISRERFLSMVERGEMIEHSQVYDDYKGVPRFEVENAFADGKDIVMRLDYQGHRKVKAIYPNAVSVFILPPNSSTWIDRLSHRDSDSADSLRLRINTAKEELAAVPEFDYLVINDNVESAAGEIIEIVRAEHCRSSRRKIITGS